MKVASENRLAEHWHLIESRRSAIGSALLQLRSELPLPDQKIPKRLAGWFLGTGGYDQAITRPDVLAVCLPLTNATSVGELTDADIRRGVRFGFSSIAHTFSSRLRNLSLLFYPAFVLLAFAMLTVVFSFQIMPDYKFLRDNYGIEGSQFTRYMFNLAWLIRVSWSYVFGVVGAMLLASIVVSAFTANQRVATENWFQCRFKTARNAAAGFASHIAILLASGLSLPQAVMIAGNSQNQRWLQRESRNWLRQFSPEVQLDALELPRTDFRSFSGFRYPLLNNALAVNNRAAQIDLFREIAAYYWASNRLTSDWLIKGAASILFWLCGVVIVLGLASMFRLAFGILYGWV